jgi:hypothetical protein
MPYYPTRKLTIFAQDPSIRIGGKIVRARVEIPNEELQAGPRGYRVQVVDYDSSTDTLYRTVPLPPNRSDGLPDDSFVSMSDDELLASPDFHAMNAYAIVMRTLARFEFALGRRVAWGFAGHQIQVAPHAFADANAFYSPDDQALLFGYFPRTSGGDLVFGCLAHDIVAHETTHALVDGLRERYTDASSPQQAGFHEGFADIVAILSLFSLRDVVAKVLAPEGGQESLSAAAVEIEALKKSILIGLAEEFGEELSGVRGRALRRSVELEPGHAYLGYPEFQEAHRCGEVLVAAVINAFLNVWTERMRPYLREDRTLDLRRATEEGADVADHLLTICIRALDYCPPTDLQFGDFASSLLTSDWEMYPHDVKYRFRDRLRAAFRAYGIEPTSQGAAEEGAWAPPPDSEQPVYDRTHFEAMQRDPDELFRFVWENRGVFKLHEDAYTRVLSVRPCLRVGYDGFALRETVAEYLQILNLRAEELRDLGIRKPDRMADHQEVTLYGGNAMVFDQFGRLKYNIGNSIRNAERQSQRLQYLFDHGQFEPGASKLRRFAGMHRRRMTSWSHVQGEAADWATVAAGESEPALEEV